LAKKTFNVAILMLAPFRNGVDSEPKSPPEDYGKKDQTTVAAFLPWRGSLALSP